MRTNMPQEEGYFFNTRGERMEICGSYEGQAAFLIANGPSFKSVDTSKLSTPGVVTMGLNNGPATFRPNLWMSLDMPVRFLPSIWLDPNIKKFTAMRNLDKVAAFVEKEGKVSPCPVFRCPNVYVFRRGKRVANFLEDAAFAWGNPKNGHKQRTVLLPALKTLFLLGFKNVYLLGVDLNMVGENAYHFDKARREGSVRANNKTYEFLIQKLAELKPRFDRAGFNVFNCNPDSHLTAFPFVTLDDALSRHFNIVGKLAKEEVVEGRYEALSQKGLKGKSLKTECLAFNRRTK